MTAVRKTLLQSLFTPLDIASLVYFRIVFGVIMLWDMMLYDSKRIAWWIEPKFHFTYFGFDWIHPLPGHGLYVLVYALRALAVFVALGLFYRLSCALFFLGFTYLFLLDQADHLNHAYLTCLLSFLMIFVPAHRAFSIDARFRPAIRSDVAPAWSVNILRFQFAVVYLFGALAKFNFDWLHGEPVRTWLAARANYAVVGPLFAQEGMVWFVAYGGLAFDLLVVPFLLCRKTRPYAFAAAVFFHLMNNWLFDIAIFPWMMLAGTALFFDSDWPRAFLRRPSVVRPPSSAVSSRVLALLALYALTQLLPPLRQFLYPGNANWTEEGQLFAWRMKLRTKAGAARFFVTDPATKETRVANAAEYLSPWQIMRMGTRPDMILQFSHFLTEEALREGHTNVEVRVRSMVSLNGRKPQLLVDPDVNLAAEPRTLRHSPWIMPLTEPLPSPADILALARRKKEMPVGGPPSTLTDRLQEKIILSRLIDEQMIKIREINKSLVQDFKIDPRGNYQFDSRNLVIYELVAKSGMTARITSSAEIDSHFDKREFSRIAGKKEGNRFLQLESDKARANRILDVLKKIGKETASM